MSLTCKPFKELAGLAAKVQSSGFDCRNGQNPDQLCPKQVLTPVTKIDWHGTAMASFIAGTVNGVLPPFAFVPLAVGTKFTAVKCLRALKTILAEQAAN